MARYSGRIKMPLERYKSNIVVPNTNDKDLSTYEDAMVDIDK